MEAGVTPGTAGAGEEWVEGDGMAIDVSQNGVGQGQERSADFEARLQFLEHRVGQMETQMREEMASLYCAGTWHGKVISKLVATVQVLYKLVERLYRMVQQKKNK
jgi:hypothetical protein